MPPAPINSAASIRILLADDHTVMRQGLSLLLQRQAGLTVIGEASNGHQAIAQFRTHRPDVLPLDIAMPLMDGITALAAIRTEYPAARGILLTMHAREGDILRGMRAPCWRRSAPFTPATTGSRRWWAPSWPYARPAPS